jgi:hypothetical protein
VFVRTSPRRTWMVVFGFALALIAAPIHGSALASESNEPAHQAAEWLIEQILDDGGFPGFDGESDPGATADAILAFVAAGIDLSTLGSDGTSPLAFLESAVAEYSESQGGAAKAALAAYAAGADPRNFGGVDLIETIQSRVVPETGAYSEQLYIHALALLAVAAAGDQPADEVIEFLLDRQIDDGSWAFTGDVDPGMGDTNTTAIVIQALVAAGAGEDAIQSGLAYLIDAQLDDGSVVYAIGTEDPPFGDSNSTALTIQAMIAAGVESDDPAVADALDALLSFQNQSGALGYRDDMPDDNALSTAQALPAMVLKPLPIHPAETAFPHEDELLELASAPAYPGDEQYCDYYERTQHNLCHGFRDFWNANGGLPIFGYPITGEFLSTDDFGAEVTVQFFERARFEYRPEAAEDDRIRVAPLGVAAATLAQPSEILDLEGPCETPLGADHPVCGVFLDYWRDFGGETVFGSPITDAFGVDGMTVQFFEYARFEHQPGEWPERHDVLLGRIGAETLREMRE